MGLAALYSGSQALRGNRNRKLLWPLVAGIAIAFLSNVSRAQRPHVIPEGPLTPEEQLAKFHLPPGFQIELVASEPQIRNPLSLSFDSKGRLWVTDTIEYPTPPKGPGRDALKVFQDQDGDGRYDKMTTMLDNLSMPTGAEPVPGGVVVFTKPSIFGCYDTSGDGRIDQRQVLYTEFGDIDAHGMNNGFTRWLDGWIYACHGFRNTSHVKGSDGHQITLESGNGYRFRLDGSHIEYVWHGQVNPYGIAFDSLGNLFTADCHSKPAYCLLRGAYYPSFGKPHDGLGFGPKLIEHSHGSTSISGIAYYGADQFPEEYRDSVFMGNSVTGRVNRDTIAAHGSSLRGTECPDFVTCDDRWFRPVELKLGPDGTLYIADFYDCIIGYYEVPLTHPRRDRERGRIWRVTYHGTDDPPAQPRKVQDLTQESLEALWARLADPNLCVRRLATHEIFDRFGNQATQPLTRWIGEPCTAHQRAHGLWILERLSALDDKLVRQLAGDQHRLVRLHLVKALAERPDWNRPRPGAGDLVREKLFDPDPFVRRAAADALGRHPDSANVPLLLRLWEDTSPDDTYLIHTARMALRDQLELTQSFADHAHLGGDDAQTHRLLEVMLGIRDSRSAEFVLSALRAGKFDSDRIGDLVHHATRYAADDHLQDMADCVLNWQKADVQQQLTVFGSFQRAVQERGGRLPEQFYPWAEALAQGLIRHKDAARVTEGLQLAGQLRLDALYQPVAAIATGRDRPAPLRIAALQACVATGDPRTSALFDSILGNPDEAFDIRRAAALGLSLVNTDESRKLLLTRLQVAHHRLATDIAAALAGGLPGAEMLLAAVDEGLASRLLLRESSVLRRLEAAKVPDLAKRLQELTKDLPPQDELIGQKIAERRRAFLSAKPDAERGQKIFKERCAICHQIGDEGKEFGPDLDGIGMRGLDRLLEDLLDPNRNVDPKFRSTNVITDDGLTRSGLALRDEGKILILVDSDGNEKRIAHDTIDERWNSSLSPMPNAAEKTVSPDDFSHLLKYLLDARQQSSPGNPGRE